MKLIITQVFALSALTAILAADTTTTPTVSFDSASVSVSQASGEARIVVNVNGPPLSDFFGTSVSMKSVDGTATWPTNYDSINHNLKFNTGDTTKTLVIGIPTAPAYEGTRSFTVRFESGSSYNIGSPSTVAVNIAGSLVPEISIEHPLGSELSNGAQIVFRAFPFTRTLLT